MGVQTPIKGLIAPSAGQVSYCSDLLRQQSQAKLLNNVRQLRQGVFSSSFSGWKRQRNSAFNSGASFLEFSIFADSNGTETLLFQVGNTLYSYNIATSTETAITNMTALSTTAIPCMRMFNPYTTGAPLMIYTNGAQEIMKVTSITAGAVMNLNGASPGATGAPLPVKTYSKPKFCEPFLNRMVYCGWQGSATSTSRDVVITNAGTPDTVTQSAPLVATDGGMFTLPSKLGAPTGMRTLRVSNQSLQQVLVIGCQRGIAMITGSDATNFAMFTLTEEFGVLSNRAMLVIQNDIYLWCTDGNIRRFSGIANGNTLLAGTMTRNIADVVQNINLAQGVQCFASHHSSTQEVEWWFPSASGAQSDFAMVMNYNTPVNNGDYASVDPMWYLRSGMTCGAMIDFSGVQYGGSYDGLLQIHNAVNTTLADTTPLTFNIVCAFLTAGDVTTALEINQLLAVTEGLAQKFKVDIYAYEDMGGGKPLSRNLVATVFLSAPSAAATVLGAWLLGTNAFAQASVKLLDVRPGGRARMWEMEISGNLSTDNIDFVGWAYRAFPSEARQ